MSCLTVTDLPIQNQKILVRVDYNVPLDQQGHISDLTRIQASLPTLEFLLNNNATIILLAHLGRPKGYEQKLSLRPCAQELSSLLHQPILFAEDCLGPNTEKQTSNLHAKEILLLENLRFYEAEEKPEIDPSFAQKLASYGDFFINDAFGACHRPHSSIVSLAKLFPNKSAAGFLVQKEIKNLSHLLTSPSTPFFLLMGGSKVSSKIGPLKSLLPKVDALFIGGAMAFTFLRALGISIGDSLFEEEQIQIALEIIHLCQMNKISLQLPLDCVCFHSASKEHKTFTLSSGIPSGWKGMDIGPQTLRLWKSLLPKAHTIFWNGPLGVFEMPPFAHGTFSIATHLASLSMERIVGGGDSAAAIHQLKLANRFTFISTGGGASLEFLEKGSLPGIDALSPKIK